MSYKIIRDSQECIKVLENFVDIAHYNLGNPNKKLCPCRG